MNIVPTVLSVEQVAFRYPGNDPVLTEAHLTLDHGRVVGLLGPNGSGKSTLLGAITDSIAGERTGTVTISEQCVGPIGYATQEIGLYTHLSVTENLAHAARVATRRWRVGDLVDQAIEDYGLAAFADRSTRELSGGQLRIAHLAASFVHQPSIRLLDEPTTALDFATREILIGLVRRWRSEGIATLVTAHYPEDVEELCSDLVLLVDGRTHQLGPLRDHLGRQSRLGTLELVAPIDDADQPAVVELTGPLGTLAEVVSTAETAGVGAEMTLRAIAVRPPSLRDLLRRDPTLRAAVTEEAP